MSDLLNCGYVSFTNSKWLDLTNILVDHINEFSKYKIQLFTINCDANFDYPCLIKTRINIPNENFRTICYTKIYASFNNIFDFGLVLDGDMIPLPNIDDVINDNLRFLAYAYPICAVHPHSPPKDRPMLKNLSMLKKHLGFIGIMKKYSYASFLFSRNSMPFLKRCYDICQDFEKMGIYPLANDESVLNILLSELGDYEDIGYNYLPNFRIYSGFNNGKYDIECISGYTQNRGILKINILHGCKDIEKAKEYSILVKNTKDLFMSTKNTFKNGE